MVFMGMVESADEDDFGRRKGWTRKKLKVQEGEGMDEWEVKKNIKR